jgi:O-antigen ligase
MKNILYKNRKILLFIVCILAVAVGVLLSRMGMKEAISLLGFLFVLLFLKIRKWMLSIVVFLIIATPGPLDNLFPSAWIGPASELGANMIPIISFVDFLMIFSIVKYCKKENYGWNVIFILFFLLEASVFLSFLNGYFTVSQEQKPALFLGGMFIRLVLVFIFVYGSVNNFSDIKKVLWGFVLGVWGLLPNAIYTSFIENKYSRLTAGTYGLNIFGNILVFFALIFIITQAGVTGKLKKYSLLFTGILCVTGFVMTGTRMSVLAFLLGILMLLILCGIKMRKKILIVFTGCMVLFLSIHFTPREFVESRDRISAVSSKNYFEGRTFHFREYLWRATGQMIKEHPLFGIGPGQWNFTRYRYGVKENELLDSHNGYLQIMAEYGIFAFFFYCLIFLYGILRGIKGLWMIYRRSEDAYFLENYFLICGLMVGLLSWCFTDFTNSGIMKNRVHVIIWITMFVLLKLPRIVQKEEAACRTLTDEK